MLLLAQMVNARGVVRGVPPVPSPPPSGPFAAETTSSAAVSWHRRVSSAIAHSWYLSAPLPLKGVSKSCQH